MIKNHTALVTGNLSSPSARVTDMEAVGTGVLAVETLLAGKLDAHTASITYATIDNLNAAYADIYDLEATVGDFQVLTTEKFTAIESKIHNLEVGNFDAEYANIDFSNIGKAAMEYFYAQSGLIDNVVVGDQTITGELPPS